jgi:hypothetical protein
MPTVNSVDLKENQLNLLNYLSKLKCDPKYRVLQYTTLNGRSDVDNMGVICGLNSDSSEPVIPVELHSDIVTVVPDDHNTNSVFVFDKTIPLNQELVQQRLDALLKE